MGIKGTSDKQLTEIIRRRSLRDDDPDFIPRALMDRFLDGHLINEDPSQLARVIDVSEQVARLTGFLGLHKHATWPDGTKGHGEKTYQALWPKVVHVPLLSEFEHIGLVDATVPLDALANRIMYGLPDRNMKPLSWPDPSVSARGGLKRYIVLTSFTSNEGLRVRLDKKTEVLNLCEAVQLVGQSGSRFLNDGFFVLAQKAPVAAWLEMGFDGCRLDKVRVYLSRFDENSTFTHNVLVRHQYIIPVD